MMYMLERLGQIRWANLPVVGRRSEVTDDTLHVGNFGQQSIVNTSLNLDAIVQRQRCRQGISLEVSVRVYVDLPALGIY